MADVSADTGRRIAVINNKGGVGKTLIVRELGAALARKGRRVLLVDMDPQGNLTRRLAVGRPPARPDGDRGPVPRGIPTAGGTLATVLTHGGVTKGGAASIVLPCGWDSAEAALIDVLPSEIALEDRVLDAALPGAIGRLRKALYGLTDQYDYTIVDCPPSMGHLTQMVIAALDGEGDGILFPAIPERDAVNGAVRAAAFVSMWKEDLGAPGVALIGAVINGVRGTRLHADRIKELPQTLRLPDVDEDPDTEQEAEWVGKLGDEIPILGKPIPLRAALASVQDNSRPITSDPDLVREGVVAKFDKLAQAVEA
jgi:chromosome partitioning protein